MSKEGLEAEVILLLNRIFNRHLKIDKAVLLVLEQKEHGGKARILILPYLE